MVWGETWKSRQWMQACVQMQVGPRTCNYRFRIRQKWLSSRSQSQFLYRWVIIFRPFWLNNYTFFLITASLFFLSSWIPHKIYLGKSIYKTHVWAISPSTMDTRGNQISNSWTLSDFRRMSCPLKLSDLLNLAPGWTNFLGPSHSGASRTCFRGTCCLNFQHDRLL